MLAKPLPLVVVLDCDSVGLGHVGLFGLIKEKGKKSI